MPAEKILVIQTAFIGDAVLTLPMIQFLAEKFPKCIIDVLAIPLTEELFSSSPFINKVFVIDKKNKHKSIWSVLKISKLISAENYSKIYSPHRSFRTSLMVLLSNVHETFGFSNSSFRYAYKNLTEYRYDFHEVKRNLELAGFNSSDSDWRILPIINPSAEVITKVDNIISTKRLKNFVTIAPGSVWATKRYPQEYFKQVVEHLINLNIMVVIIGSKDEFEICSSISNFKEQAVNLAGELNLIESIQLLKHSKLLISNDSAPTHLAMCADIPTITIYCSTVPEFGFYPYNNKSQYIGVSDLHCKPCGIHGYSACPLNHFNCGNRLLPQNLFPIIEKLLNDES